MREIAVIVAALVGAVMGYLVVGGGQGMPAEIVENPDFITRNTSAILWMIGGALALPWVTNRWIEDGKKDAPRD
jgi:hypothetical protein